MPKLADHEKRSIVLQLAQFQSPAEVAQNMFDDFGLRIRVQQIVKYDPARSAFEGGHRWRALFEAAREQCLKDISSIPVAHQGYRLRLLQKGIGHAEQAGNWRLVAQLLEQAAREVGGALTNAREISLNEAQRARHMSPEQRRALLASIIEEAMSSGSVASAAAG